MIVFEGFVNFFFAYFFLSSRVKSTTEPSDTGTLRALPSILPFRLGNTNPIAEAAPVEEGTIFVAHALPRLDSIPFYEVHLKQLDRLYRHVLLS